MYQNKTQYFLLLRNTPTCPSTLISIDPIAEKLKILKNKILILNKKQDRNSLPSFDSKEAKRKELTEVQVEIETLKKNIETEINSFVTCEEIITNNIKKYLILQFKNILAGYKKIKTNSNHVNESESSIYHIPSNSEGNSLIGGCLIDQSQETENLQRNINIKSNIVNLSSSLMQLKLALQSQSSMIDSIDYYFDKSNSYLNEANKQIDKLPGKLTAYKDWIIYTLFYIICCLLMMILIKTYLHNH
jgi:hypothetical protein